MKNEKSQTLRNYNWKFFIFVITIGIIIFLGLAHISSDSFFCKHNPQKCVCERWNVHTGKNRFISEKSCLAFDAPCKASCNKYRIKTQVEIQAEVDRRDCEENPRDDDKCRCLEYKCIYPKGAYSTSPDLSCEILEYADGTQIKARSISCIYALPKN